MELPTDSLRSIQANQSRAKPGFFLLVLCRNSVKEKREGLPGSCEGGSEEFGSEFCVLYEGLNKRAVFRKFGNGLGDLVLYAF